jgi:hypothetical protein
MSGTCCDTIVKENGKPICCLLRLYDGYPEGHGVELAEYLANIKLSNGIPIGVAIHEFANGMGCLAAQIITHFKTKPGNFYMCCLDNPSDYVYVVYEKRGKIHLRVTISGKKYYDGLPSKFRAFVEEKK